MSHEAEAESSAFTVKGECPDEVEFHFTEDRKLYVSKGFLIYSSPVFKRMFSPHFKEGATGIVNLETKNYEEFLEFLSILNPGEKNQVTEKNMFSILELATEYQISPLIECCKQKMLVTMSAIMSPQGDEDSCIFRQAKSMKMLMDILSCCVLFSFSSIKQECLKNISQFGSLNYTEYKEYSPPCPYHERNTYFGYRECKEQKTAAVRAVKEIFDGLQENLKMKILLGRLKNIDNNKVTQVKK